MKKAFDFIIVGAGAAGCVLANRLSRDPNVRVLLLEAGDWDKDPLIKIPVGIKQMTLKNLYRWNDVSEPDPELNGRKNYIPHGRIIGGGTSINYMAHTRGHPADYDGWAEDGAEGWSYKEVLPYFKECETWEGGEDLWRGGHGELGAQAGRRDDPIFKAWFDAVRECGHDLTDDYNGAKPEGFGMLQSTIKNGQRTSSASAFLHPALGHPNLTVVTKAIVTKLIFSGKKVIGVEYLVDGRQEVVHSQRTVVSSGAINSPHLLLLSGIGPAEHLNSMGIKPIVDLPVGKNLQDHLAFHTLWTRKQSGTFHKSLRIDRAAINMLRALLLRTGPSARLPGVIVGFIKSRADLHQPDIQYLLQIPPPNADVWFPGLKRPYADGFLTRVHVVGQKSTGEVLLRSANPNDRPRVFYNSLSDPRDLDVLRAGFKQISEIMQSSKLADFRGQALAPSKTLKTDAEIDEFIRNDAFQQYHPACTCRMGNDSRAVVDPFLNVHGLEGLSVVDASVMPRLVSANPNIPVMMIAAKAAAMWLGNESASVPPYRTGSINETYESM